MLSSSMSIPSSIRSISLKFPQFDHFPSSSLKPLFSFLHHNHPSSSSSFKSISFQPLPTSKPPQSSSIQRQPIEEQEQELPPKLQEIIKLFQAAQDPRAKYQQLLFYANNLSPLSPHFKTNDNKVHGCVSQVWVRAFLAPPSSSSSSTTSNDNKVVYFEADSDSVMTKGLAALLVLGLSGLSIPDIVTISPDFITLLGLHQNLTPSRNNGFLNMFKLMQRKALLLGFESEKSPENGVSGLSSQLGIDQNLDIGSSGVESSHLDAGSGSSLSLSPSPSSDGLGRRGERIREILKRELNPVELELEDVSYQHAGHMGVKDSNDEETHFNLKIVSNEFEGKSLVKRHRMIYGLLQDELEQGLHALSIIAKTPLE